MGITFAVARIFDLIFLVLFITILLTWIPSINWRNEPFKSMAAFSEIFFGPFRKIIPPIGMIDISPIIAFIVLSVLRNLIIRLLLDFGL